MKLKQLLPFLLILCLLLAGCETYGPPLPTAADSTPPHTTVPTAAPSDSILPVTDGLTVHYIDVGQADCILLESGGHFLLIDGGNREDSSLVVTYLQQQGVQTLDAVICTHAHEDHVGGLPGVLAVYPTKAVYSPTKTYASKIYDKFMYYVDQQGLDVTLPVSGTVLTLGDARITILGPLKSYAETNDTSIILKAVCGQTSFLFTGDMEMAAENDLMDAGLDLKADVLKVGHHGSHSSTGYRFLYEVDPAYAVISVGKDNDYGHPHQEPMSRLEHAGCTILRTDRLGHILAHSDGRTVTFTWQNQNALPDNADFAPQTYIGNVNSRKFHTEDCDALPSEKNRIMFDSYRQAMEAGYTPCGNCIG